MPEPFNSDNLPADWFRPIPKPEDYTSPQTYRLMVINGERVENRAAYLVRVDCDLGQHCPPMVMLGELTVTSLHSIRDIELEIARAGRYLLHPLT